MGFFNKSSAEGLFLGFFVNINLIISISSLEYLEGIFSIFPFGCEKCTVSFDGFEYGLENGILNAEFPLGVSNVIKSDEAKITLHEGSAICMLR